MSITLVYDLLRWEEKELIRRAGALGIGLELVCVEKDTLENVEGVALQRCVSYFKALNSTAILEGIDVEVHESLESVLNCGNKVMMSAALHKKGVQTPDTRVEFSKECVLATLEDFEKAVLKPVYGSWGRLVAALNDAESAESILECREYMGPLHSVFYIQERLDVDKDIRTLVVGDEVIGAMYRKPKEGSWKANVAQGSSVEALEITPELEEISLSAANAVGGSIVSVDLFEKDGELLVNEVNHRPEFRGLCSATGVDVPGKILNFLEGAK